MKKIYILLGIIVFFITGCNITVNFIKIDNGDKIKLEVGETIQLTATISETLNGDIKWVSTSSNIDVSDTGFVTALKEGIATVCVVLDSYTDTIEIEVLPNTVSSIILSASQKNIFVGDSCELYVSVDSNSKNYQIEYFIQDGDIYATINKNILTGKAIGSVTIVAKINNIYSNTIIVNIIDDNTIDSIILSASKYYITIGEESLLSVDIYPNVDNINVNYKVISSNENISLKDNIVTGLKSGGDVKIVASIGNVTSNEIIIHVVESGSTPTNINIKSDKNNLSVGMTTSLSFTIYPSDASKNIQFEIINGFDVIEIVENNVYAKNIGTAKIQGNINGVKSNIIEIVVDSYSQDPYLLVSEQEFYNNYFVAINYLDAYYRSLHNFMSGSILEQTQEPTLADYQPEQNGVLLRNSYINFDDNNNTYIIMDYKGNNVFEVYRGGAYISLEEVAAYVFAFGDVPANYVEDKNTDPTDSDWGKYLRLNNSYFKGDVKKYPYEPVLPNIRGAGGELYYYELDLGTIGTDCDPKYEAKIYNDGVTISRGAARIVYVRYDKDKKELTDINERYLFYTYNHYNDFQEYLNYQGGWGKIFGNITGGGTISSTKNYNPTPYINSILYDFNNL